MTAEARDAGVPERMAPWIERLVEADISLHSMEVINCLAGEGALSRDQLRRFVSHCISQARARGAEVAVRDKRAAPRPSRRSHPRPRFSCPSASASTSVARTVWCDSCASSCARSSRRACSTSTGCSLRPRPSASYSQGSRMLPPCTASSRRRGAPPRARASRRRGRERASSGRVRLGDWKEGLGGD